MVTGDREFLSYDIRGTGKSVWLDQVLANAGLDKGAWVISDEVQKLHELMDEAHALLFESGHAYNSVLSRSS